MVRSKPANNMFKVRRTWALVAHRAGAQIFQANGRGGFSLIQDIPHPEGLLRNRDINADRPGRVKDRKGRAKHSMSREHSPTDQMSLQFCKQLAKQLDKSRTRDNFDDLILVVATGMLGKMRAELSKELKAKIVASQAKDLAHCSEREVIGHLKEIERD